ncbi:hypothetical protein B0H14DRAFT_3152450 [Mycena olivaceomarginata]|nr:hypothetical protein B0H14DRAFT_3152450 [Mycena olivaceomarginata]
MSDLPAHLMDSPPPRPSRADRDDSDDEGLNQSSASPRSSSPLAGRSSRNPLKRPAENMEQYADSLINKKHLKTASGQDLKDFSRLTGAQQSISIYALLLKNRETLESITPSEAVHHISTALEGRIERAAFLIIVDPATPCYVHKGVPINRVIDYLGKHGLTPDIKNDKSKFPVYQKRSGLRLTHYRNVTKDLIGASRGTSRDPGETVPPGQATRKDAVNILELTQNILLLGSKAIPDAKLSLALVARVAWLRWVYETILAKSGPGAPNTGTGLTRASPICASRKTGLGRFLNDDFALYGTVFVEDLTPVSPINMDDDK